MSDFTFNPARTALVAIDLQSSIISHDLQPHSAADVVANTKALADKLRALGGKVIFVNVLQNDMRRVQADAPLQRPEGSPPIDEALFEIVPEAGMQPEDELINKRQWGAFYGTRLEQFLRRNQIDTILMTGVATNFGVESTARQAFDLGFNLIFASDAISTFSPDMHSFCVDITFPKMGFVNDTKTLLDSWFTLSEA